MRFLLVIVSIACLWGGGQSLYTYLTNSEATAYSVADLREKAPDEKWLAINNCYLNLTESVYFEGVAGDGKADELFIPIRSTFDDQVDGSYYGFVVTKDINLLNIFNAVNTIVDDAKLDTIFTTYESWIFQQDTTVTGIVQFGIDLDNDELRQLRSNFPNLNDEFVIIEAGTSPSLGMSIFFLVVGVPLFLFSIRKLTNR
jgi:hypothetical protein